jgi:hypothetical protein
MGSPPADGVDTRRCRVVHTEEDGDGENEALLPPSDEADRLTAGVGLARFRHVGRWQCVLARVVGSRCWPVRRCSLACSRLCHARPAASGQFGQIR